jgi:S-adenosylmethionine hydrolase
MRAFLVDWLAELHFKFKMWPETLYVTIGIIDKFLAISTNISKQELQILGITALLVAGKYEEIYPPDLKTILKVINNVRTKEEVLKME